MSRSTSPRRRLLWILAKRRNDRLEVLTIVGPDGGGEALPVFSFKEEAEAFLRADGAPERGWRVRETTAGELVSVLYGLCAGVKKVALDPPSDGGAILDFVSMDWEGFVRYLVGGTTEEVTPDYVMRDFGFPRGQSAPSPTLERRFETHSSPEAHHPRSAMGL